ncbi:MAG: SPOR domain-containing protein [Gammaproteobacteria bacterium]|nr:SPOR domain-containing protein [Gammaproteobacteria bacterium]
MAKDYKNSPKSSDKKPPKPAPGWVWMLAGLAIGLFVALLVYIKDAGRPNGTRPAPAPVEPKKSAASPALDDTPEVKKPRFDFYNLLPEMEVFIPPERLAEERERQPADAVSYYLQVGSFRKFAEADRLRAQLALSGIESHIQRITINESQTWHRVRVGPFSSARKMDKVRGRLRAQSFDPMVLKVKGTFRQK